MTNRGRTKALRMRIAALKLCASQNREEWIGGWVPLMKAKRPAGLRECATEATRKS